MSDQITPSEATFTAQADDPAVIEKVTEVLEEYGYTERDVTYADAGATVKIKAVRPVSFPQMETGWLGCDLSVWQDDRMDTVAMRQAKVLYAYIKFTQGRGKDPKALWHWKRCQDAGIARGSYSFYDQRSTPKQHVDALLEYLDPKVNGWGELDCPMWDVEYDEAAYLGVPEEQVDKVRVTEEVHEILTRMQEDHHVLCGVYTSKRYWRSLTTEPTWVADYPLWVAHHRPLSYVHWRTKETVYTEPLLPTHWTKYRLWQYTNGNTVKQPWAKVIPGTVRPIDQNVWGVY